MKIAKITLHLVCFAKTDTEVGGTAELKSETKEQTGNTFKLLKLRPCFVGEMKRVNTREESTRVEKVDK